MTIKELMDKSKKLMSDLFDMTATDNFRQPEVNKILKMSSEDLANITQLECDLFAYKVLQHCLYMQSLMNNAKSAKEYLNYNLRKIISREISQYKGMSWDNAEMAAIRENQAALEIKERIVELDEMLSSSYGLVPILKDMAKRLESLRFSK